MQSAALIGREAELAAARAAMAEAAVGRGSVLVIAGEPGIGKTALLEALTHAAGWRVVRTTGVEAEGSVAFATLQGILWPLRSDLDQLESGQARLLGGVMNLGPVEAGTTFAVGAATLALLSVASRGQPLLVIVDDAHWADVASQEVLAFVGRRLGSERIAMLAGVRESESSTLADEKSFRRITLLGLPDEAARELLQTASRGELAPTVVETLLAACAGNPLGLLQLPLALSDAQRHGDEPLPDQIEAGPSIQKAFAARAQDLDEAQRRALLVLAAAGGADAIVLTRLAISAHVIAALTASGLVEQRAGTLSFRHPLMQAAVYGAASPAERRAAHRDLAAIAEGARRAWHLAAATAGPDESVALALVQIAGEVRLAGGLAAEAAALERAAELTPDPEFRARRMLAATQAWRRAGRLQHGLAIADRALPLAKTVRTRAELQLERGRFLARSNQPEVARNLLLAEADRAAQVEPGLAARMLVEGVYPSGIDTNSAWAVTVSRRAMALAGRRGDLAELEATNAVVEHRTELGEPPNGEDVALVMRAAELLENPDLRAGSEVLFWISYCLALFEFDERARTLSDIGLAEARTAGDVWNLCYGLYARAAIEQTTGRLDAARPYAIEGLALAEDIGEMFRFNEASSIMAELEAFRGAGAEAKRIHAARRGVVERDPSTPFYVANIHGCIALANADFEEGVKSFEKTLPFLHGGGPARGWYHLVRLGLAEAYLGAGRKRDADAQLRAIAPEIEGSPLLRPKAKLLRVEASAAPEGRYDTMFSRVTEMLDAMPQPFDRARTELAWGGRLAASKRTGEAASHMERALAHFEVLGAVGWADRTRRELQAVTGKARQAVPRRTDVLTPQEMRIAQHAAGGMRDREIAAVLYLSPRTVESYLQSAYRKLDVSNRTQLAAVLSADGIGNQSPVVPR